MPPTQLAIPGPTVTRTPRHPRLVDIVLPPGKALDVQAERARLQKALLNHDAENIRLAASRLDRATQLEVCDEVDQIRKSEQRVEKAGPPGEPVETKIRTGPFIVPQTASGFLKTMERGTIFHAEIDGTRHHFKALKWGSRGVTGVNPEGDVAAVAWPDVHVGVHSDSQAEYDELVRRRDAAALRRSLETGLYALSPEQRGEVFKSRDGA